MNKLIDWFLYDVFYKCLPYDYRPPQLWYRFTCWFWYRYRTVHPKTLPGHTWVDRDKLLVHTMFQILTDFIEKEQKEYREEDYAYVYTEQPHKLVEFKGQLKDPHYILDYLYKWWHSVYTIKEDTIYDKWHNLIKNHSKSSTTAIPNSSLSEFKTVYNSNESKLKSKQLMKRSMKKDESLHKELEENLILLIKCKDSMWT